MNALVVLSELNSARTLRRCLSSLQRQDYTDFKVVVVDGGSEDDSQRIAFDFVNDSRFYVFSIPGCSEAQGQKWAIENFPSEIVCLTNSDCYVENDWIRKHVFWHEKGYDMVGGKLFWGGDKYGFAWSYPTPPTPTNVLTSGLSIGFSNCSISKPLYDRVGGFHDMKSQHDMEFWIRATDAGMRLVMDPKIEVYHDHPMKSLKGSFLRSLNYGRNHVTLLRAAWGRGPWPNYVSYPYSRFVIGDLMGIYAVKVWKQQKNVAEAHGIDTFLPAFLFRRLISFKLASIIGWFFGFSNPFRNVSEPVIKDAHRWGK